nr:immunoglobulin light chain junction region [Macaca mulatta]MOW51714.1 immunoglobulin light chain junction region [Macaca mulatta]MOW51962.1 immunoglobulin light chain junction region [Macaca mulatta]MOW52020.1 immunoglobulin light chain junction region [Macaca mulatta]MOW52123.1 immunoglobulin light chain junction region [Macaca mulatta]
CMHALQFPWTF